MTLVDALGCWTDAPDHRPRGTLHRALFLDRDGVIIEDVGFPSSPDDVKLIPTAAATVAAFNDAGWPVVIVSNQSGIARGLFGWHEFELVTAEVYRQLEGAHATISATFACGYHADGIGELRVGDHPWRKPNPGMLLAAASMLELSLDQSWIVGDRVSDVMAGANAGLGGAILVDTGLATAADFIACEEQLGATGFELASHPTVAGAASLLGLRG